MRGYLKIHPSSFPTVILAVSLLALIAGGCSGGSEAERPASDEGDVNAFIAKHEATFNPSRYNPDVSKVTTQENSLYAALHSASVTTTAQPETIPGFRIQVILTQEIDQAMSIRDSLTNAFPDELLYVVYDAPTYKIRIGNYREKSHASSLLKQLNKMGFLDAWIVPDNVLKNPPVKLPDRPIEPKNPLQNRH